MSFPPYGQGKVGGRSPLFNPRGPIHHLLALTAQELGFGVVIRASRHRSLAGSSESPEGHSRPRRWPGPRWGAGDSGEASRSLTWGWGPAQREARVQLAGLRALSLGLPHCALWGLQSPRATKVTRSGVTSAGPSPHIRLDPCVRPPSSQSPEGAASDRTTQSNELFLFLFLTSWFPEGGCQGLDLLSLLSLAAACLPGRGAFSHTDPPVCAAAPHRGRGSLLPPPPLGLSYLGLLFQRPSLTCSGLRRGLAPPVCPCSLTLTAVSSIPTAADGTFSGASSRLGVHCEKAGGRAGGSLTHTTRPRVMDTGGLGFPPRERILGGPRTGSSNGNSTSSQLRTAPGGCPRPM